MKAEDVENVVSTLSATIHRVQVTEGFSDVLDYKQLDDVYCAAIKLSTAVTEYLGMAIVYFENKNLSKYSKFFREPNQFLSGKVKTIFENTNFSAAKAKIDQALTCYQNSMGFLTAVMAAEILQHDKNEKR